MNQYNSLNVKLSNSQFKTDFVFRLSSNMIGDSEDEANFPHKLL